MSETLSDLERHMGLHDWNYSSSRAVSRQARGTTQRGELIILLEKAKREDPKALSQFLKDFYMKKVSEGDSSSYGILLRYI